MKKLISIIAPMYNEELLVHEYCKVTLDVLSRISNAYDYEIILVNDGSSDSTLKKMEEMREQHKAEMSIINLTRNFGLEGAIHAGLSKAKGDVIVTMDADLQDPPALILEMLRKYEEGVDIVTARRIRREHDGFIKKISAHYFYNILKLLSGKIKLEHNAANYRLLTRKALEQLLELYEANKVFRIELPFIGMKSAVVDYERDKRFAGKTKYSFISLVQYALDGLTSISIEPLRKIALFFPILLCFLVLSVMGTIISSGQWQIFFLIVLVISFIALLNLISISILAEYIAQIVIEVKHRPVSIIYDYFPSENSLVRERGGKVNGI